MVAFNCLSINELQLFVNSLDSLEKYKLKFNAIWSKHMFYLKKKYLHFETQKINVSHSVLRNF